MFHFEIRHVQVHLQVLDWTGNESLTMTHYSGSHLAECYKIIEKYKKENAKLKNRIIELQVELNGRKKLIKAHRYLPSLHSENKNKVHNSIDSGIGLSNSFQERKSTGNESKRLNCKPELSSLEIETGNEAWSQNSPRSSPRMVKRALTNSHPAGIIRNEPLQIS